MFSWGITRTLIRINLRENRDLPGAIQNANAYLVNNNAGELFAHSSTPHDPRSGELEYSIAATFPDSFAAAA